VERARFLMGTVCRVTAYGLEAQRTEEAVGAALDAISASEAVLGTWSEDSELSRVNRQAYAGPVGLSPELSGFLVRSLALAAATGGAFDPTVGALVDAWDLRGQGRVASPEEIRSALARVGYRRVELHDSGSRVLFRASGLWLESGAAGKGHALDRAAWILRGRGVQAALLDFGGQLLALGAPPGEEGWTVAVADPRDRQRGVLSLSLQNASAATSAQGERSRQVGERSVGHILDPRTGKPVERRGSTTVVASSAMEADALATALFVLGTEKGLAWARGRGGLAVAFLDPEPAPDGGERLALHANEPFLLLLEAVDPEVVRR
jgi:thiamine biosynthesis lipoprotein